ncbi:MAG: MFS transporter [Variovorax sp.]
MTLPSRYGPAWVGWLSFGQLISWGSVFYAFALLLQPVEESLGLTRGEASLAFSLALLTEGLAAWQVGRWIDRGHERSVMTGGSLLLAAALFAHSFVDSAAAFYAVWIALGAGLAATLYTPAFAIVTRRFPLDFRRAIITLTFLGGLASTVFIPLTASLVAQLGWRHALWVLAAIHLLVCAPLHAWLLRDAPAPTPKSTRTTTPDVDGQHTRPDLRAASHYLQSAPFLLIGVFIVLMMAVTVALPPHMVSLLRGAGLSEYWAVAIPASIGVMQVAGRLLLYFFERHFDAHLANRLIPCLIPLALLVLLAGHGQVGAGLAFVLLWGLGNGMLTIVKGTAIAEYVDRTHVATLNGALGPPSAIARALAPLMLGLLWSEQRGYAVGLWVLLAASVVGVLAFALAQRRSLT